MTVTWGDPNNSLASTFSVNAIENAAGAAILEVGDTISSSTDRAIEELWSFDGRIKGCLGFAIDRPEIFGRMSMQSAETPINKSSDRVQPAVQEIMN